ncbi:cytochrome P450 [Nocardia jejuensis]|uniref:cytochrome P450 n=1 Tax=Nocardia jejuensis TaxID=328049 RepID=UPI001C3F9048|nr:cytochrome P450 [Nocardia jejuensis]
MSTVLDIYDPELYVEGPIHETLAELRRTQPVYWQEMPGEPGYWAVLRHADVAHVARHPELFSAEIGGVILENQPPERLEQTRNMLLMMDPPRHTEYRKPLAEHFKARVIGELEDRVRELTRALLDGVEGDVEFVHDVAGVLPSQVVGGLFGIPERDWPNIRHWAEQSTSQQDPELAGDFDATAEVTKMAIYAIQFAMARREQEPRADLTSLILAGEFGGKAMSDLEFGSFFTQLVTAGNDTTKTMLSSGLELLLQHPEQLAALRADPKLLPGAVEEILRYANPLHYFRRTATADTEIRGVRIKAGDKVAMWYTSANRDEEVFVDPQRFDIRRNPNPHLSFGLAQHFCLGVHLARLEGRVFFEELLSRFPRIEQTGNSRRIRSNLNNGLKSMPVRLSR